MFKVNNNNTTSLMSFWCFYCWLWTSKCLLSRHEIVEMVQESWNGTRKICWRCFDCELNYVALFHFFQENRIKIIIRETFFHTSFVILCVLAVDASVDPNSQRLYQSAFNLVAYNGITNEYFDGKTYDHADFDPDRNPKDFKDPASVSRQLGNSAGKIMIRTILNSEILV